MRAKGKAENSTVSNPKIRSQFKSRPIAQPHNPNPVTVVTHQTGTRQPCILVHQGARTLASKENPPQGASAPLAVARTRMLYYAYSYPTKASSKWIAMLVERAIGLLARPAHDGELAFCQHFGKSQEKLRPRLTAIFGVC
jgi:hypothetical protein